MIKKTLYFGNPAYLSLRLEQLVIKTQKQEDDGESPPGRSQLKTSELLFLIIGKLPSLKGLWKNSLRIIVR